MMAPRDVHAGIDLFLLQAVYQLKRGTAKKSELAFLAGIGRHDTPGSSPVVAAAARAFDAAGRPAPKEASNFLADVLVSCVWRDCSG